MILRKWNSIPTMVVTAGILVHGRHPNNVNRYRDTRPLSGKSLSPKTCSDRDKFLAAYHVFRILSSSQQLFDDDDNIVSVLRTSIANDFRTTHLYRSVFAPLGQVRRCRRRGVLGFGGIATRATITTTELSSCSDH